MKYVVYLWASLSSLLLLSNATNTVKCYQKDLVITSSKENISKLPGFSIISKKLFSNKSVTFDKTEKPNIHYFQFYW